MTYYNYQGREIDATTLDAVRLLKKQAYLLLKEAETILSYELLSDLYYGATKCHTACFHLLGLKP